jgi:hypothetical protein
MANRNNRKNKMTNAPKVNQEPLPPVSISVRLPGHLAAAGRTCVETMGISMNALICVSLADYVQSKGYSIHHK